MVDYTFGPWLAIDQGGVPVPNAAGQVFAESDVDRVSPLSVRNLNGLPVTQLFSGATGILEPFIVTDLPVVVWVSGGHEVVVPSWSGMIAAVDTALGTIQVTAGSAEDAATSASAALNAAQAAQQSAALSAAAAEAAAAAAGSALPPLAVRTSAGSTSLTLTDVGKIVELTASSATTVTVPTQAAVAFPVGVTIGVRQYGSGQVTVAGSSGVTIRSRGGALKLAGQYAEAMLTKRATNEWVLTGDVTTA